MQYYKWNAADYAKETERLSILQLGAYSLLINACYDRECFPTESEALMWTRAVTSDERLAVFFVLKRFFDRQSDGTWVHKRIAEDLKNRSISASDSGQ